MKRDRVVLKLVALLALGLGAPGVAQNLDYVQEDPAAIVTAESCGECHISEAEVWKKTPHAKGFKTLHRKQNAAAIAERMGFPLIKRESLCLSCHFTTTEKGGHLRAVAGVSCESCHGAGRDWIDIHNDYGKGFDYKTEPPEHRRERIAKSRAAGMRRPSDLYGVATSCYGCHTVPEERLVNVGHHSIGSADFELVEWSQGIIRHNFLRSFLEGDGTTNVEISPERRRLMFVVGRAVDLEFNLRGLAKASEEGVYLKAMQRRLRNTTRAMQTIERRGALPAVSAMLDALKGMRASLGHRTDLLAAADKVGAATRQFLKQHDGRALATLDPLVLGTAEEDDFAAPGTDLAAAPSPGDPEASEVAHSKGTLPPASPSAAGQDTTKGGGTTSGAVPAVGQIKKSIRRASQHATISASACQKCHGEENGWWFEDVHSTSADPFFEENSKNVQIARLYGISPSKMSRGDQVCMDCHGTVVTGRGREVQDGVSCQGCHGAAKDFLEPHEEGDNDQGLARPGYVNGLKLGMLELKNLKVRAETCTGCHYVTDPRLISSGHPSGAEFDYVDAMPRIRHWDEPAESPDSLKAVFSRVISARGVVPEVRLAQLPGVPQGPSGKTASTTPGETSTASGPNREERLADPTLDAGRSTETPPALPGHRAPVFSAEAAEELGLPPFPEFDAESSVEDILLRVKERLELLYRAVGRGAERSEPGEAR